MPLSPEELADAADRIAGTIICECSTRAVVRSLSRRIARAVVRALHARPVDWAARERRLRPHEKRFTSALAAHWAEERRIVLANMKKSARRRAVVKNALIDSWLFPRRDMKKKLSGTAYQSLYDVVGLGVSRALEMYPELGASWELANESALRWLDDYTVRLSGELEDRTAGLLEDTIKAGIENGETMDDLAARVSDVFDNELDEARAEMIARTETMRAENHGNVDTFRESGIEKKTWIANPDCCDLCLGLDGEVVGIDEAFPGLDDDWGDDVAHPNCRCSVGPWDDSWDGGDVGVEDLDQ